MSDTRTEKLKRAGWTEGDDGTMHQPETPRTDENEIDESYFHDEGYGPSGYIQADFARQLERELALAVEALKIARPYIDHSYIREKVDAALAEIVGQP